MLRQRLRARTSSLSVVGRVLVVVLALLLIWYGLMLALLALKLSPGAVNAISGYRTVFDALAGLRSGDVTSTARIVAAVAGVLAFLVFGYLALKEIPRPYLARSSIELSSDARGVVVVEPRAIERAAEAAALGHEGVTAASGRLGDDLVLAVTVSRARGLRQTLDAVSDAAVAALAQHDLPATPVLVKLTGFDRKTKRELD